MFAKRGLTMSLVSGFSKWSKPKPLQVKLKEFRTAKALGDEKAAKLSKSELENEAKRKKSEEDRMAIQSKLNIQRVRNHSVQLQEYISPVQLKRMHNAQLVRLKGILPKKVREAPQQQLDQAPFKLPSETVVIQEQGGQIISSKLKPQFMNYTNMINAKYQLQPITPTTSTRRCGVLGKKLGMTSLWDQWGRLVPLTIIELDRVQVVQIKPPVGNGKYYNIQVGSGQANYKKITKPMMGHFMKHDVPPKRNLVEFPVSKDALLPQGYMIGARHFTPGMFVDVIGKTVGHGFSGTIKRFGFRRQPETHGNSRTTRVLGSTGGRQDPGRVFKQKKMYGRMGGKTTIQSSLRVFKIDCDKNIVYLFGTVPGKGGNIVKIRDTTSAQKHQKNLDMASYPTFIQQPGMKYARQFIMNSTDRDPEQIQYHDNSYILDDKQEDPNAIAVGVQVQTTANITLPED